MHQAALLKHSLEDSASFGWNIDMESVQHDWVTMSSAIQNYIRSLNFAYRTSLRGAGVEYINARGELIDKNTIKAVDAKGSERVITTRFIILATGERPRYLGIEGDREHCITSDDLFWLNRAPGKTLVIGASYVALECAGFLHSTNMPETTVWVRSILLRGFDQEMSERVGKYMQESLGIKFVRPCIPTKIECVKDATDTDLPLYKVTGRNTETDDEVSDTFNTILVAIGRDPCTKGLNLEGVGVKLDGSGYVICDDHERTSVDNVFAIGDIVSNKPKLTPVAIQAGQLLASRLFSLEKPTTLTEYDNIPTTVFTPLEYGCVGLSEEDAIQVYGVDDIEVLHMSFKPLEWTVPYREDNACFGKLVCVKSKNLLVVGFHVLAPNAGEVTQGYALGMKLGARKADFDRLIGIHPTNAEAFTTMEITKRSGLDAAQKGC
jgi:thioredoxin reductase (NADPH)